MHLGTKARTETPPDPSPHYAPPGDYQPGEFRRKSIINARLLWTHRTTLAKAAALGCVVGLLLAFTIPNEYQSTVQLMPPDNAPSTGMMMAAVAGAAGQSSGLGAVAGDLLGIKNSGAKFVGILHSRTVQDRLVQHFGLKKIYKVRLEEDARKRLSENTSVSEDRKSGIISITVSDRDAQRAAAIAQSYVDELDLLSAQLSTSAAHRERVFLEERLKAVKLDLDDAAREFSQFASKNATIDIKEQGRAMVEAAAMLQGQIIAAQSELKGLEAIYTANNVRVRSIQARITELQHQLDKVGGGNGGVVLNEPDAQGNSLYPSIRQLPLLGVTYADLYRRSKIEEVVFQTLTQQYEVAKVEEAKETPSVKVLDQAIVAERKSFPPRSLIALLFGFIALAGTIGWVVARVRWERTDDTDPGKVFAQEIFHAVSSKMPWATPNGSRAQALSHELWLRLRGNKVGKTTE